MCLNVFESPDSFNKFFVFVTPTSLGTIVMGEFVDDTAKMKKGRNQRMVKSLTIQNWRMRGCTYLECPSKFPLGLDNGE